MTSLFILDKTEKKDVFGRQCELVSPRPKMYSCLNLCLQLFVDQSILYFLTCFSRIMNKGLSLTRPSMTTGKYVMIKHEESEKPPDR